MHGYLSLYSASGIHFIGTILANQILPSADRGDTGFGGKMSQGYMIGRTV